MAGQGNVFPNSVDVQPGMTTFTNVENSISYMPLYGRWPSSDTGGTVVQPYPNTLSTSVLPQLYSTGLVDERSTSGIGAYSNAYARSGNYDKGRRYPQYWNDYTAFPQLGSAYSDIPVNLDQGVQTHIAQQPPLSVNPSTSASAASSSAYLPEQYNMYSTIFRVCWVLVNANIFVSLMQWVINNLRRI